MKRDHLLQGLGETIGENKIKEIETGIEIEEEMMMEGDQGLMINGKTIDLVSKELWMMIEKEENIDKRNSDK